MKASPTARAGFTLVEVMVAMGVSAILLTVLWQLFTVSYRVGTEEISRSAAEQGVLVIGNRLAADLQSTKPGGVSLATDGRKLVVHPVSDVTVSGRVAHADHLFYWSWDEPNKRLTRTQLSTLPSGAFDGNAKRLTPTEVTGLPVGSGLIMTGLDNVVQFQVTNPPSVVLPLVGGPLDLSIHVEVPDAKTRQVVRYETKIQLRTGGA